MSELHELLLATSNETLIQIVESLSKKELFITAIRLENEALFNEARKQYNLDLNDVKCFVRCNNDYIISEIIKDMDPKNVNTFFSETFWYPSTLSYKVFSHFMASEHTVKDDKLMMRIIKNNYADGVKYMLKNERHVITDYMQLFETAVMMQNMRIMDMLYAYINIHDVSKKCLIDLGYMYNNSRIPDILDRLVSYGYNLQEILNELTETELNDMYTRVYIYLHDRGIYYNQKILLSYHSEKMYTSRTYWKACGAYNQAMIEATWKLLAIPYSDKLMANRVTDIIIVCPYDI